MSDFLILKTDHYKFKIKVSNNTLYNKIISKYFLLGDESTNNWLWVLSAGLL